MSHKIKVASYNVLANSYIKLEWYTRSNPEVLQWENRKNLLTKKITEINADIICLQEVETDAFEVLENSLKKSYSGVYYKKGYDKPDGCATFFRKDKLSLKNEHAVYYSDEAKGKINSGHLALVLDFEFDVGMLRVANTHLKWDNKNKGRHLGYKQITELIDSHIKKDSHSYGWVMCGDFNAQPNSFVIKEVLKNNFEDAYANKEQPTCNPNGRAKRIDFIFHSTQIVSSPTKLPTIEDTTPLPSEVEPSDHLAIMAELTF